MVNNVSNKNSLLLKTSDNHFIIDQYDISEIGLMQHVSPIKIWKNSNPKELIFDSKSHAIVLLDSLDYKNEILTFNFFKSLGNNQRAFQKFEINPSSKEFRLNEGKTWKSIEHFKPVNIN